MHPNEVTQLEVERYFADELTGVLKEQVIEAINKSEKWQAYIEKLQHEREAFLKAHPVEDLSFSQDQLKSTQHSPMLLRLKSLVTLKPAFATGAVALLIVFLTLPQWNLETQNTIETPPKLGKGIRTKGSVELKFDYRRAGLVSQGDIHQRYRSGDKFQFFYTADKYKYISLLSFDSKGVFSYYNPHQTSLKSRQGARVQYPKSIVLDNTQGYELFIMIYSQSPLKNTDVKDLLSINTSTSPQEVKEQLEKLKLKQTQIKTLLIEKE